VLLAISMVIKENRNDFKNGLGLDILERIEINVK
jgi:hypothetical protein